MWRFSSYYFAFVLGVTSATRFDFAPERTTSASFNASFSVADLTTRIEIFSTKLGQFKD